MKRGLSLRKRIYSGYFVLLAVICGMTASLLYDRRCVREMETCIARTNTVRQEMGQVHRHITELAIHGEGVIGWTDDDVKAYRSKRLHADSLLQAMKPGLSGYADPARIDTLCRLLEDKEAHLAHVMQAIERRGEADSLMASHLPEVARRATRVHTVKQRKSGLAGVFGGKKTVQVMPSAKELHAFSDSLIALQSRHDAEMEAYSDSLRSRNKALNIRLNGLINDLDNHVQAAFAEREMKMAEAQALSMRLFTATISAAIILLFLSCLAIHRELKRNADEKRRRDNLIKELEASNEKNRELIRLRRNLIQTVTHELRTPLTAISGNAELLLKDKEADGRAKHAKVIEASSKRMGAMINNLLEYFRLDSGKVSLLRRPFRLGRIAETLEAEFTPVTANKGLELSVASHADEVVDGDREKILAVGGNLLSNAVKFTKSGTVSLSTDYKDGMFTLSVEDTGTGIDMEQRERIFKPFERLGNAATEDGFGLGLAIVAETVGLMGGSIGVDSRPGKGSKFTVTLPLDKAEETMKSENRAKRHQSLAGRSILVIDNDRVTLGMVRDMFASEGVACDTCANAGELTEAMRAKDYDLLVTDLKMPDMDGYEVLELLRTSDIGNSRGIPVVAATAAGYVSERDLKDAGFAALLAKPFSMEELLSVTERCIGRKGTARIDLAPLLAFGDRRHTLDLLTDETGREMEEVRRIADAGDIMALDAWIHHVRSSWMLIKAEQPLTVLHEVIHGKEMSGEKLQAAIGAVLRQGANIMETARKEAGEWEG